MAEKKHDQPKSQQHTASESERAHRMSELPTILEGGHERLLSTHLEAGLQTGGKTIVEFMKQKDITGGVSLDEDITCSLSSILAAEQSKKYSVGNLIARGGMGIILNAKEWNCRRKVAMKTIGDTRTASKDQILRFIIEAQITAQLEHPGIVPIYELGVDAKDDVFYTMKLLRGNTLVDILEEIKDENQEVVEEYSLIRLLTILTKICEAVGYAHSKGVVHRDLKPENVMIGDYGEVLLMDWGLAKIIKKTAKSDRSDRRSTDSDDSNDDYDLGEDDQLDSILSDADVGVSFKTIDGQIMGTPGFMPPEQALGKIEQIDERSDVYALGAILYNMLVLQPSVMGRYIQKMVREIVRGNIKSPASFNKVQNFPHCPSEKIPEPLSAIAMKALSTKPEDRYQTVRAFQNDIEKYIGGFATSVEEPGVWNLFRLLLMRHKTKVIWILVMSAILAAVVAGFLTKIVEAKNLAETNLNKFLYEQNARQEISRKLLVSAIQTINIKNPNLKEFDYRYSLKKNHFSLTLENNEGLSDIGPLRVVPISSLNLNNTGVSDLSALKELPLKWLSLTGTKVRDLSPMKYVGLNYLDISNTRVADIKPLLGMKLKTLNIDGIPATDLEFLKDLSLESLTIDGSQMRFIYVIVEMNLRHLSIKNVAKGDIQLLTRMKLESLELHGRNLDNLWSLEGLEVSDLALLSTDVRDLSALMNIPVKRFRISRGLVRDIDVVKEMPLTELRLEQCYYLKDITPIAECSQLKKLLIPPHITEIDFLRSMPNLKVLADNVKDFDRNQSAADFWEKFDTKAKEKLKPAENTEQ
jgi:serine/threonine protein kinase